MLRELRRPAIELEDGRNFPATFIVEHARGEGGSRYVIANEAGACDAKNVEGDPIYVDRFVLLDI